MLANEHGAMQRDPAARPRNDLPRIVLPARERTQTDDAWYAGLQHAVQRAYDLALYLDAQSAAADQRGDQSLITQRADQAARAQRAYQRMRRTADRIIGHSVSVAPSATMPSGGRLRLGEVTIDLDHQVVLHHDRELQLTAAERTCLTAFAVQPQRTWSREALMYLLHGDDPYVEVMSRTIDVHLSRLRSKLGHPFVTSVPGIGWHLAEGIPVGVDATASVPGAVIQAVQDRRARWIGGVPTGSRDAGRRDSAGFDRLRRALEAFDLERVDRLTAEQTSLLEARLRPILARLRQRNSGSPDTGKGVERRRAERAARAANSGAAPGAGAPRSTQPSAARPRRSG